jgi:hypothetical protein
MSPGKKPEIKPVPVQPVIPPVKPEVTPVPEKPDKSIKPEMDPETEPVTTPGKEFKQA